MPELLNNLESAVLEMLLRGDQPVLEALRVQLQKSTVASRQNTGAGFFADFLIPDDAPRAPGKENFVLGDVSAEIDDLEHGAGFLLFIRNGKLDFLEGYSFDEPWPAEVGKFKLQYLVVGTIKTQYVTRNERDFSALSREWST